MSKTLFERIGGEPAVQAAVSKLYDKILTDELLAPFFENIDVDALRNSQKAFVMMAFGGPQQYTGKTMRAAHANAVSRGLSDAHFDRVALHLQTSMQELNVPPQLIEEALSIVGGTRNDVLNK